MPHPWIPSSYIKNELMKEIGISSILELFSDVPKELLLVRSLNIGFGKPLTEYQLVRVFDDLM
ncbi:MAG: glycine dehydrogenase, partial [Sulfolobales archaeon]